MNRKFLEDLLSSIEEESTKKEIIDKIMEKNGELIEKNKKEVGTLKNEIKVKESIIEDLNAKIKSNAEVDLEAIKKEEYDKGKAEGSKEVEAFKKDLSLSNALKSTKAKDVEIIKKMLNIDDLKYEEKEGKYEVTGYEKQIEDLKKSHSYLFEVEDDGEDVKIGDDHKGTPPKNDNASLLDTLKEVYK